MAVATETAETGSKESFAALLDESLGVANGLEGTVVKGRVISIENDAALIDVGLKSEGRVALKEFSAGGAAPDLHVGDIVEVFLERMEDKNGEAQLSREKARREEAWTLLEKSFQANERVTGTIFGRVKGGFTVDLSGATDIKTHNLGKLAAGGAKFTQFHVQPMCTPNQTLRKK